MTKKLRELGEPRLGIALIWLVPTKVDGVTQVMAPVTDEELEHFRQVTGVDAEDLMSRLQRLGAEYQKDPEAMRTEIMRLAGGDEEMADLLIDLMRAAQPDEDDESGDMEPEEKGQVIEFRRPTRREDEDDGEPR